MNFFGTHAPIPALALDTEPSARAAGSARILLNGWIVTFRIVERVGAKETVLELHGWLNTGEVTELESVVARATLPLCIDLEHVAGANADGLRALLRHEELGARLTGASPYIELLLSRTAGAEP
jgi:hypothetical protein